MLARLGYAGLQILGIPTLARRWCNGGVILCYHNVLSPADSRGGDLSLHMPLQTFERQMRWLAANFEIVSLRQFLNRLQTGASLRRVAAVTFDDGYAGVLNHAWPLLTQLGIPATMFVVADAPGHRHLFWWDHPAVQPYASRARRREWLTRLRGDGQAILASLPMTKAGVAIPPSCTAAGWLQIARATASGMGLGVHSATHRSLPALDDTELQYELATSRDVIAREVGVYPEFFAYPYGLWDNRTRRAVRAAGYRAAFTLDYGLNRAGADAQALRRMNVPAGITDSAFQAWAAGIRLPAPRVRRLAS
jgi:peptidoglycan/xylan/chitin deacetylase (PgdA/CDA1 family)